MDQIKGFALSCLIGAPLIGLFLQVITWGGPHFYLYVAALFFVVQILAVPFYSNFIQPCFNKLVPLQAGALREAIEALATRVHFPLKDLYVIDGSKRSSHSNAYFTGLPCGHKRIVLFDTLIDQSSQQEVLAVLGHEVSLGTKGSNSMHRREGAIQRQPQPAASTTREDIDGIRRESLQLRGGE